MGDTKKHLYETLPKYLMLGHGQYSRSPGHFTVPERTLYIFVSKSSRYLLQSVVNEQFYKYFSTKKPKGKVPSVLEGWQKRVYGPGDRCSDISLQFKDPNWPGMGIHKIPLKADQLKTTKGFLGGQSGSLSEFKSPPGVYFIVACRAVAGQNARYTNQKANYLFTKNSTHQRLGLQNAVSSRFLKRRIANVTIRKTKNEPPSKKRKVG